VAAVPLTATRVAKPAMCPDCHAAVWVGLDADAAALPVVLDRGGLDPYDCARFWPDLYVIRMNRIYQVFAPRRIDTWESAHTTHRCTTKREDA
jgi:hypothetical protein